MSATPRDVWLPNTSLRSYELKHFPHDTHYILKSDYDELQAKLDSVLLDKGLSEVMKSQLNARIQNCEAALEERDQQFMDAQAKIAEAERKLALALEAMKSTKKHPPNQTPLILNNAIKELEKPL